MTGLSLSFISNYNERVEPLMTGAVKVEGVGIIPTYSHPSETFWRQLKFQEFDVAEMSMSSYLIARSRGVEMIALPVFPSRRFFMPSSPTISIPASRNPAIPSANASG